VTSTPSDPTTGDYPDKDLPEGDVESGEGSYTDQETPEEKRGEEPDLRGPDDRGEYTDSDPVPGHRPDAPQGGYTSKDNDRRGTDEVEEHPHG
jgi:hypothetical protein